MTSKRFHTWPLLVAAITFCCAGCLEADFPPAGSYSEVLLVTEDGARDPFARELEPYLAKELNFFVSTDVQFKVQNIRAEDVEVVPYAKNVVFCGAATPISSVGQQITLLLGEAGVERVASGQANVFKKQNLPGPGQVTLIVTAASDEALHEVIEERGPDVAVALEASCRERLRKYLLKDRKSGLTSSFQRKYGFTIEIPHFYRLLSDEADPPGVELLRDGPPRSLGVFWVDWEYPPTLIDRDTLFDIRADYVFKRYDGDEMDRRRVSYTIDRLGEAYAVRMEGYWSNSKSVAGGYYKTYFVFEEEERLLWVVDLLVYAPGLPKHPHFRELLAIAETFRY
jgi:hypothetical protein